MTQSTWDKNIAMQLDYIERHMRDMVEDDGVAAAYVYTGDDAKARAVHDQVAVHAMVRSSSDVGAELVKIDLYVPYLYFDRMPGLKDKLIYQDNMRCIGIIDNHFSDVFGLVNPIKTNIMSVPQSTRKNIRGQSYLSATAAKARRDLWLDNVSSLTESKAAQLEIYERFHKKLLAAKTAARPLDGGFSVN